MRLKASVIICSRNRAQLLASCLRSALSQRFPMGGYEVVVVDNASNDPTANVVRCFQAKYSNLRYVYEGELGVSRARNRGLEAAQGEYVAFLDDDSEAAPGWLESIVGPFPIWAHRLMAVGGPIYPNWLVRRPDWFTDEMLAVLLGKNHGIEAKILKADRFIAGGNMAFRRQELVALGGFDESIIFFNDECELLNRLRKKGGIVYYSPDAKIRHIIPAERARKRFFIKRYFLQGISNGVIKRTQRKGHFFNALGEGQLRVACWCLKNAVCGPKYERVVQLFRLCGILGELSGGFWRGDVKGLVAVYPGKPEERNS